MKEVHKVPVHRRIIAHIKAKLAGARRNSKGPQHNRPLSKRKRRSTIRRAPPVKLPRQASGKSKDSKVAKLIALAKMRTRQQGLRKVVKKVVIKPVQKGKANGKSILNGKVRKVKSKVTLRAKSQILSKPKSKKKL